MWTACVTPFSKKGDEVDYESLQRLLERQAEAENGIVLLGSTGESLSLTESEKHTLVKFVCKLQLNTQIIVGVPGINLHQTLGWLDFCKDMPIHGYLMTTPIYTKPGIIGQTLWFERLLEKAHVPAILYNIPSRAGINLHPETVRNLSSHDKFWAIKDSSGTTDTLIEYKKFAPNVEIFCGDDNMIDDMAAKGASGLVSVASNIWPEMVSEYVKKSIEATHNHELPINKNTWHKACKALFIASNPIPTKALLYDIGFIGHKTVRLPLSTEDLPSIELLRQVDKMIRPHYASRVVCY